MELFFFLPGVDAPHVYVRAWALGCFYSHISTRTFRRALTASLHGQLRGDKECPFSGVTKSGRVWRKVPESYAGSVPTTQRGQRAPCPLSGHNPLRARRAVCNDDQRNVDAYSLTPASSVLAV